MYNHKSLDDLAIQYPDYADFFNALTPRKFFITPRDVSKAMLKLGLNREAATELYLKSYIILLRRYRIFWTLGDHSRDNSWCGTIYGSIYDIPDGVNKNLDCVPILVENY